MRVCFVFDSNRRTGANLALLRHAAFLSRQDHDVSVVFEYRSFPKSIDFVSGAEAVHTWYLDEYPAGVGLQDVVVTNWWLCAFDLALIPARLYSFYRQGNTRALFEDHVFDALIDAVYRENFLWICLSDALAVEVIEAGQQPIVLPNGVDFQHFSSATPSLPPKSEGIRVLVEGPVSVAFKRVDATIGAIRELPGVEIAHMSADGSRPAMQVNYAVGAVDSSATAGVYASCDLIVKLSSAAESFAMPVLEQFAAGGTAVVTGFPGHDQYINASNAIVVDIERPFELAAASIAMLRDNPQRLAALKCAASATARRFDWGPLHQRFAATLESAVSERPSTPQRLPLMERYLMCQRETLALWVAEQQRRMQVPSPEPASGFASDSGDLQSPRK